MPLSKQQFSSHLLLLFLALFWACLFFCGCINLKPEPDPTRFFVLSGTPSAHDKPSGNLRIALEPIDLPSYLNSRKMATKKGQHEIVYEEYYRWTEDLDLAIAQAVRNSLESNPKVKSVSMYPWKDSAAHDYQIKLLIHQFEGNLQGQVTLVVDWTIIDVKKGHISKNDQSKIFGTWDGSNYTELVGRMSELLKQLCTLISENF